MCGWNVGLEDVWARLRADPSCRYKYPPPWRHSTYIYKDKEFKMPFTNIRRTEIMFRPCHLLLLSKLFLSICFAMCVMSDNLVSCSNSLADWWLLRSNELHIPTSSCFFLVQTPQVQQTLKTLERRRMDGKLRYISIVTFTEWANFNRKINIFNGFILKIIKNREWSVWGQKKKKPESKKSKRSASTVGVHRSQGFT